MKYHLVASTTQRQQIPGSAEGSKWSKVRGWSPDPIHVPGCRPTYLCSILLQHQCVAGADKQPKSHHPATPTLLILSVCFTLLLPSVWADGWVVFYPARG